MDSTDVDFYQLDIPLTFFDNVYDKNFFKDLFYSRESGYQNRIIPNEYQKEKIIKILNNIENNFNSKSINQMLIYSYFIQIIQILNESFDLNTDSEDTHISSHYILEALEYIRNNFRTIRSVDEVSAHCFISTTYLCKLFNRHFNTTLSKYIISSKIAYAQYLLKSGKNVSEACYESGFNNYPYFIKVFREYTGLTPLKFKKLKKG